LSLRTRWAVAVAIAATAASVSNAFAQAKPGQGSLGMNLGVPYFTSDADTRDGQVPRVILNAHFQYKIDERWRFATGFGYGWVGYKETAPSPYPLRDPDSGDSVTTKRDVLTKIQPIQTALIYSFDPEATKWAPYAGLGATITRMEIVNKRKRIKDPATFDEWVNWSFGANMLAGTELWMGEAKTVSLDWSLRWTYLFSKDLERFPSGFQNNDSFFNFNFGVNVYFWPGGKPIETAKEPVPEAAPVAPPAPAPDAPAAPAAPDSTHKSQELPPVQSSMLYRGADESDATFGAFGVTLPRTEEDGAACAITREKRTTR
jgi:hypothetical protein